MQILFVFLTSPLPSPFDIINHQLKQFIPSLMTAGAHEVFLGIVAPAGLVLVADEVDLQVGLVLVIHKIDLQVSLIIMIRKEPLTLVTRCLVVMPLFIHQQIRLVLMFYDIDLDFGLIVMVGGIYLLRHRAYAHQSGEEENNLLSHTN